MVRKEFARNFSTALKAAVQVSGRSREDLQDLFENDPTFAPLYLRVLWAAGMNGHDETLRAMGATLGEAVRAADDRDSIDDADQALLAMGTLGPRHFKVLRTLIDFPRLLQKSDIRRGDGDVARDVAHYSGLAEDRAIWCLEGLVGAGLVASRGSFLGAVNYTVTRLGAAVVHASDVVAAADTGDADQP